MAREGFFSAAFLCILLRTEAQACSALRRHQVALMENIPQKQIKTVRMAEIAQRLGVASSTISRALRNDPRISVELRKRVRSVADELGYQPNPLVSALMANRRRRGSGGAVDVIALVTNYGGRKDWRTKDVCRWEYEGIERRAQRTRVSRRDFRLGRLSRGDGQTPGHFARPSHSWCAARFFPRGETKHHF